jgi:hypothetical protein
MNKTLFLLFISSLIYGCRQEDVVDPANHKDGLQFFVETVSTRGAILDKDNLTSMAMFCTTTENADFDGAIHTFDWMYNAHIERTDNTKPWEIKPATAGTISNLYWKTGATHSFFAVAPYEFSKPEIVAGNPKPLPEFTYTIPNNNIKDHVDLLYTSHLNVKNKGEAIPLKFSHALSQITFSVKLKEGVLLVPDEEISIHGIALENISPKGKLTFKETTNTDLIFTNPNAGNRNNYAGIEWVLTEGDNAHTEQWTDDNVELAHLKTDFITAVNPTNVIEVIKSTNPLFMIPQSFAVAADATNKPRVVLAYHEKSLVPTGGTLEDVTKEISVDLTGEWVPGSAYHYTLTFNPKDGKAPLSISTEVTDWTGKDINGDIEGGYFNFEKRLYGYSDIVSGIAPNRKIEMPFETDFAKEDLSISVQGGYGSAVFEDNKIVYTESKPNDSGEPDVITILVNNKKIKIYVEIKDMYSLTTPKDKLEADGVFYKSQMLYTFTEEMIQNDYRDFYGDEESNWNKNEDGTIGVDVKFTTERVVAETYIDIAELDKKLTLSSGSILDNAGAGYNTPADWGNDFGEKKLRLKLPKDFKEGSLTIKFGEQTKIIQLKVGRIIATDYTNQKFVERLTDLATEYSNTDGGLRVANSYILSPYNGYKTMFYIPVNKLINKYYGVNTISNNGWTTDTGFKVELSWYDGDGIDNVIVEKSASPIDGLEANFPTASQNAIRVVLPANFQHQNITVNVKQGRYIIWSWHLWITDYNPYITGAYDAYDMGLTPSHGEINTSTTVKGGALHRYASGTNGYTETSSIGDRDAWTTEVYNNKMIMDRNVGATAPTYEGHGLPIGSGTGYLGYQYGRKDPFPGDNAKFKDGKKYAFMGYNIIRDQQSMDGAVKNPARMIYSQAKWSKEAASNNLTIMWDDATLNSEGYTVGKSIFDPSPLGYRLPINGVWSNFSSSTLTVVPDKGANYALDGDNKAYYPSVGFRSWANPSMLFTTHSLYISASPHSISSNLGIVLEEGKPFFTIINSGRATLQALRAIQE